MVVVDAAFLVAFVLGATSHPRAALLAARIVRSRLQLFALDLLIHVTAAALDHGSLVARRTLVRMTFGGAHVVSARTSAGQLLAAGGFARRYWIQTAFAFTLDDGLFATRARRNEGWREDAISAGTCVTYLGAGVIVTAQLGSANSLAAESGVVQIGHRTDDLLLLLATVTLVFQGFLTLATITNVALLLARVNPAVERPRTDCLARNVILLAALQRFRRTATPTATLNHRLARRTRPRMAEQRARVLAQVLPAARFSARMCHVTAVVLRVLLLATEAEILARNSLGHVLTGGTTPTVVRLGRIRPLGGAAQVKDVIAVRAGPNRLRRTDQLAAHETLYPARVQLADELLALRTLGDDLGLKLFLPGTLPLITIWSPFLRRRRCRSSFYLSLLFAPISDGTLLPLILRSSSSTIPESSSSGVSLPSSTTVILLLLLLLLLVVVSPLLRWPILLVEVTLFRTIPGIVKVSPTTISAIIVTAAAAVIPASVVPPLSSVVVLLLTHCSVSAPTTATILLGWSRLAGFILPARYELGRSWLQTGRRHAGRWTTTSAALLDRSSAVELRDELFEALVVLLLLLLLLLASSTGRGTFAGVGHPARGGLGLGNQRPGARTRL